MTADADSDVFYCKRHPQVETVLRCGRCETPICPRCLVQSPVGARCPDCARVSRIPTVDVSLPYLARGIGGAIAGGVAAGAAWGYVLGVGGFGFFLLIFAGIGLGWAVSESVSLATNRRRGQALQGCVICGVVVAYFVHNIVAGVDLIPRGEAFGYLTALIAAVYGAQRISN